MNREITFRAWDSHANHFIDTFSLIGNPVHAIEKRDESGVRLLDVRTPKRRKGTVILTQYTGMKDKNGKKIYEGDLVTDGDEIREVWFDDEIESSDYNSCAGWGISWVIDRHNVNVIGNIYENPELIEEQ